LAILFYGGLAGGFLLAGLSGQGSGTLSQYLFGSLTTVTTNDIYLIAALAAVVGIIFIGLSPQLFSVCSDEEYAKTQGLKVRWLNLIIVIMAATTVAVSMRTVGVLLVGALMVVPVASANNLVIGFSRLIFASTAIGVLASGTGTVLSVYLDTACGATIVITAICLFVLSLGLRPIFEKKRARTLLEVPPLAELPHHPASDSPRALSGDEIAVLHGDHVDFLIDGHRRAPHGDHFDEH
jgi:zinc transport system permease protein